VKQDQEPGVQSVDRALYILEALGRHGRLVSVTELSHELGIHKSTVFRLLNTLVQHRLAEQDPETQRYKLGLRILDLSNRLLSNLQVRTEAMPHLRELAQACGESVHLGVLNAGELVYIDKVEDTGAAPMYSKIGRRAPVHCTAMGKAMLAFLPIDEARTILEQQGLTRKTPNTICSLDQLLTALNDVRQQGFSFDDEEHEIGIRCVGAPILDHRGSVVAALSVSGPCLRITEALKTGLAEKVRQTGLAISARLGYDGPR